MPRRLLLMRHGRTAWNAAGRAQGHADVPLDQTGHAQAAAVAPYLGSLGLAALWSSDLARARETVEYVAIETGLSVKYDERLREFDVGERQGLTLEQFEETFPEAFEDWSRSPRLVPTVDGETEQDVRARIVPVLEECLWSLEDGETGLVVTHGAALKVGLIGLLGWQIDSYRDLAVLDNCAWATVSTSGPAANTASDLTQDGRLRLEGYNQKLLLGSRR